MTKFAFSIGEAAQISGLGRTSIYLAIARGDLLARKVGRRTIVLSGDLQRYLKSRPTIRGLAID